MMSLYELQLSNYGANKKNRKKCNVDIKLLEYFIVIILE